MASPKIEVFALFTVAGAPATGIVPTFSIYKNDLGANLAQPVISEIGGGFYKFTPTTTAGRGICYVIDATAACSPRYLFRYIRPEDWWVDDIKEYQFGRWRINTSNNRLEIYAPDGVTLLTSYDLKDSSGNPTSSQIFDRLVVP